MRIVWITLLIPFVLAASDVPGVVPLPVEKPERAKAEDAPSREKAVDKKDTEKEQIAPEPPEPVDPPPSAPDEAALAACEAQLETLGTVFKRQDGVDGPGICGLPASYSVDEIVRGISIAPTTQMRCRTVLATARWIDEVVIPAAKVLGDDVRLTGIRQASTYVCRTRNSQPGAKISEHARGNAVDVRQFEFDGHDPMPIQPQQRKGSPEEAFQKAVRAGACLHFTTVLGPGSDAFHDDHLHMDLAQRRSGYRLCQ
ncbi:extensin family protein [Oricola indica]|uniref:extensin-like domain-containing protein n=1 Tax=Oricola indica TaxID=2872591 RepID=UPI003CCC4408